VTTRDKREAAMRRNPRAVRFADLQAVLEDHGFVGRKGKGDHWVFEHPLLSYVVTVDPRRPHVLPVYVRNALRAIDEVAQTMAEGGN
jgi:predicted RNA binding protein YcfA (HicA-like mRNA interferase family)